VLRNSPSTVLQALEATGRGQTTVSLLLTRQDVANELRVSTKTVDRLITKGCFKAVRIGTKAVRIPYTEVQTFAKKDQPILDVS
jgi:excisionase family DNA binding protein